VFGTLDAGGPSHGPWFWPDFVELEGPFRVLCGNLESAAWAEARSILCGEMRGPGRLPHCSDAGAVETGDEIFANGFD